MKALLHTDGLHVGHAGKVLVNDARFTVHAGEVAAVVGINGSGKSTLLHTVLGLHAPLSGSVQVDGHPLTELSAAQRARLIGAVLTGRPRVGLIDVRTLVSLGRHPWTGHLGRLTTSDHERMENALRLTGTLELAERAFDSLSDGEAQKVLVARAVAQDTPVLVLDEPTAHLDVVNRVLLFNLLRDLSRTLQRAILLSTHDLATAVDLCDRILVIHEGKLWAGTPQEALASDVLARAFSAEGLFFDPATRTLRPASSKEETPSC